MMAALLPGAWLLPSGSPLEAFRHIEPQPAAIESSEILDEVAVPALAAMVNPDETPREAFGAREPVAVAGMEQAAALAEAAAGLFAAPEQPVMRSAVVIDQAAPAPSPSVDEIADQACSTSIVRGLSEQLMEEIETIRPGTVASIADIPGIETGPGTLPYLQRPAVDALRKVATSGAPIKVNSALRSLAQQYLLHRWYRTGRCGIPLAAPPGNSHHESGLAVDIGNYGQLRTAFTRAGWRWLGSRDPVHFDFLGDGATPLGGLSVLAFQRLWNRNNPHDLIPEDGLYGGATAQRLSRAPSGGFAIGPDKATAHTAMAAE